MISTHEELVLQAHQQFDALLALVEEAKSQRIDCFEGDVFVGLLGLGLTLGRRTPPDWWDQLRREECRARAKARGAVKLPVGDTPDVPENSRDAYEKVTADMFSIFMANGQPEGVARANAEKFAQECTNRGDTGLAEPLLRLLKS